MAYMNQENKKEKLVAMKKMIAAKYPHLKVKFTMGVQHHSTLVFNLWASTIDFEPIYRKLHEKKFEGREEALSFYYPKGFEFKYEQVNEYHLDSQFEGEILDFFKDVKETMMEGNHDRSDIMTDYFDVGWYIDINIGRYDKPYAKITP